MRSFLLLVRFYSDAVRRFCFRSFPLKCRPGNKNAWGVRLEEGYHEADKT